MLQPESSDSGSGAGGPLSGATATGYRSIAYRVPAALHARLKAAWWATRDEPDGAPSLAGLVERAFTAEACRLEARHNAGAEFPLAPNSARGVSRTAAQRQGEWLRGEWERRRRGQPPESTKTD